MNKIDQRSLSAPKFGLLAGVGGIVVYLLSSLPFILIVAAVRIAELNSSGKIVDSETTTKILDEISKDPWTLAGALLVQCLSLFLYVWLVSLVRGTKNPFTDFGLKFKLSSIYFLGVGIVLQLIGLVIGIPLQLINESDSEQGIVSTVRSANGLGFIFLMIMVALVVPFAEELCFRGLFLRGLAKKVTPLFAILITGSIFAGVHLLDPGAFLGLTTLLIVGFITSALAIYRGRIDASICLHIGFNLTTVVFLVFAR